MNKKEVIPFWERPVELVNEFTIIPGEKDTPAQRLNSLARLLVVVVVILYLAKYPRYKTVLGLGILLLLAMYMLGMPPKQPPKKEKKGEVQIIERYTPDRQPPKSRVNESIYFAPRSHDTNVWNPGHVNSLINTPRDTYTFPALVPHGSLPLSPWVAQPKYLNLTPEQAEMEQRREFDRLDPKKRKGRTLFSADKTDPSIPFPESLGPREYLYSDMEPTGRIQPGAPDTNFFFPPTDKCEIYDDKQREGFKDGWLEGEDEYDPTFWDEDLGSQNYVHDKIPHENFTEEEDPLMSALISEIISEENGKSKIAAMDPARLEYLKKRSAQAAKLQAPGKKCVRPPIPPVYKYQDYTMKPASNYRANPRRGSICAGGCDCIEPIHANLGITAPSMLASQLGSIPQYDQHRELVNIEECLAEEWLRTLGPHGSSLDEFQIGGGELQCGDTPLTMDCHPLDYPCPQRKQNVKPTKHVKFTQKEGFSGENPQRKIVTTSKKKKMDGYETVDQQTIDWWNINYPDAYSKRTDPQTFRMVPKIGTAEGDTIDEQAMKYQPGYPIYGKFQAEPRCARDGRLVGLADGPAYLDTRLGQIRYNYKPMDAYRVPNFITRSEVDTVNYITPDGRALPEYLRRSNAMRSQYDDAFQTSAIQFRQDMMERLMRKNNQVQCQLRKAPIRWGATGSGRGPV